MSKTYRDRKQPDSDPKTWKIQKAPRSDRHMFYSRDLFQRLIDEYEEMAEEDDDGEFFEGLKNEDGDRSPS